MNRAALMAKFKNHRLFVGERANDAPIALTHRRIFILPSSRGLGFGVLVILLLLIAFVYGNNLVYLLAFLLSGVLLVTILHSFMSLSGLVLQQGQSKPVFAGDAAGFAIHVSNPSKNERQGLEIGFAGISEFNLAPLSKATLTLYSPTSKRGWHEPGKVTIASSFPLGLFRAWSPIRFDLKVLVYPKPAAQLSPFPENSAGAGAAANAGLKGSDEFYGVREYQAGDAIKHIHWKAFAKGQGVLSKQYGGENASEIWLDYAQTHGYDKEEKLRELCRWVITAEQMGIRYGFCLSGLKLPPSNGFQHYQQCLEALALF